jgi:hypothetical protein
MEEGGCRCVVPQPTPEQEAAVAAFADGSHLVLQAGAGSGKTTMLAAGTRRRGPYLAFNMVIAHDAQRTFPSNIGCRTAHSMAFRAVGWRYVDRLRAPRMSSAKLASMLGINRGLRLGRRTITASGLADAAQETVIRYCQSADEVLGPRHVPWLKRDRRGVPVRPARRGRAAPTPTGCGSTCGTPTAAG